MQQSTRVQGNIVARQERRFLTWACAVMPRAVTSDHLTVFGMVGAAMVCGGYAASWADPRFLLVAVVGYVMHWFGDSLDGSLARHRRVTRPRYGYFLDHSVDALAILMMVGGMGLSPYVHMSVALFAVVGYFALCIHVFLKNHVTGTFQLSFMALGPTELRLVFVAFTLWMYVGGPAFAHLPGSGLLDYDIGMLVVGGVFATLFGLNTLGMVLHLRRLEGDGRLPTEAVSPRAPVALSAGERLGGSGVDLR